MGSIVWTIAVTYKPLRPSRCLLRQTWKTFRDKGSCNKPPPPAIPTPPERFRRETEKHFVLQFASNTRGIRLPHLLPVTRKDTNSQLQSLTSFPLRLKRSNGVNTVDKKCNIVHSSTITTIKLQQVVSMVT